MDFFSFLFIFVSIFELSFFLSFSFYFFSFSVFSLPYVALRILSPAADLYPREIGRHDVLPRQRVAYIFNSPIDTVRSARDDFVGVIALTRKTQGVPTT